MVIVTPGRGLSHVSSKSVTLMAWIWGRLACRVTRSGWWWRKLHLAVPGDHTKPAGHHGHLDTAGRQMRGPPPRDCHSCLRFADPVPDYASTSQHGSLSPPRPESCAVPEPESRCVCTAKVATPEATPASAACITPVQLPDLEGSLSTASKLIRQQNRRLSFYYTYVEYSDRS
jgi:hypothetical protein